jgi:hypothetical protein
MTGGRRQFDGGSGLVAISTRRTVRCLAVVSPQSRTTRCRWPAERWDDTGDNATPSAERT